MRAQFCFLRVRNIEICLRTAFVLIYDQNAVRSYELGRGQAASEMFTEFARTDNMSQQLSTALASAETANTAAEELGNKVEELNQQMMKVQTTVCSIQVLLAFMC